MNPTQAIELLKVHYPNSAIKVGAEVWYYPSDKRSGANVSIWIERPSIIFYGASVEECVTQAIAAATAVKFTTRTEARDLIAAVETK